MFGLDHWYFCIGSSCLLLGIAFGLIWGIVVGAYSMKKRTQMSAANAGIGYYVCDKKTGEVTFLWCTRSEL